ncbi:hypothetical protein [Terrihalobacillus insolitus]|uniref:hypothetical protein n=1 Tax=Terrihalobacillus insolitus TaxID=2950438 RepID=UPI002340173A|nr:hypothetical protein [Terrihalobacillus insolitus]MDC3413947.1 hypothetical protein [Terrihalobacillus insolitus]
MLELIVGLEMTKKMAAADIMERVEKATTIGEKTLIVQETERFVFEIADEIFIENLPKEGIKVKDEFIKGLVEHNYRFFNIPNPFENGVTLDEIKARNGYAEEDEFFVN